MIFLIAGQSNARGLGAIAQSAVVPSGRAYSCAADANNANVQIVPLADPFQQYYAQVISNTGSAWPAFANAWWEETQTPIVFCGGAVNGQGLVGGTHPWTGNSRNLDALVAKANDALAALPGESVAGMLWLGGEQDAKSGITRQQWLDAFTGFVADVRAQFPDLPIYMLSLDSSPAYEAGYAEIRKAQADAAASIPGVYVVTPFMDWYAWGWHLNNNEPHWNQAALNAVGILAAREIARLQLGAP